MKTKYLPLIILIGFLIYLIFPAINNYFGWYGYKYWTFRVHSQNISESKQRKIFVKELKYKFVDSIQMNGFYFKPFIEKGFKFGKHSMQETYPIKNSKYPYNLNFEWGKNPYSIKDKNKMNESISVFIKKEDLEKIDSSDAVWGYLEQPKLRDTITIEYSNYDFSKTGTIKVW